LVKDAKNECDVAEVVFRFHFKQLALMREIQRSIMMAIKGGHEDVLQYACLAYTRLSIAGCQEESSR
jgi:hypothetical protein